MPSSSSTTDVVVIGGGPAGSTVSTLLAQHVAQALTTSGVGWVDGQHPPEAGVGVRPAAEPGQGQAQVVVGLGVPGLDRVGLAVGGVDLLADPVLRGLCLRRLLRCRFGRGPRANPGLGHTATGQGQRHDEQCPEPFHLFNLPGLTAGARAAPIVALCCPCRG